MTHFFKICFCSGCLILLSSQFIFAQIEKAEVIPLSISVRDSILSELSNAGSDSLQLEAVFKRIRRRRRTLKDSYKAVLHTYIRHCSDEGFERGEMLMLDRMGVNERFAGRFDSAVYYHNQSLVLALQQGDSLQLSYNYNNLGQVYRLQDMSSLAIANFHKALAIQEAIGNTKGAAYTQNTLGAAYVVQEDYPKALYYFNQSLESASNVGDKRTMSYNYGAIGEVYLLQDQVDSAMYYFNEAKNIKLEIGDKKGLAVAQHLIGQAWYAAGNMEEASASFQTALSSHIKNRNTRYAALCYDFMGKIMLVENKMDSAAYYLDKAKVIAEKVHKFEYLMSINKSLIELYQKREDWPLAIEVLNENQTIRDSVFNLKKNKAIQTLEIEYQTEKRQHQIDLLSAENDLKNQGIQLGIAIIVLLLLSIALGVYVQSARRKRGVLERDKLKQQLLRSQMNPHFLFNALGSIQSYMYKNDVKNAARYMGNFAALTRSILNNSNVEQVSLEEELSTLRNYLELEKMRMQNSFDYKIELPDTLDIEFVDVPPMMVQPFVENAIKHGVKDMSEGGMISISFKEEGELLHVVVVDNGIGLKKSINAANKSHRSMATAIFNQRIKIIQKNYPNVPAPLIQDISGAGTSGTQIDIFLPIMELSSHE
ncbi:tetratricopeptide repeat-containing sensor histidine kinase [Carboxylicivirga sp. N1Y90]|uniref:tetratricopeptide repeat-containing sensor histidine kinase n=1 Tax=Carboxylicivirga fragile TaxID=3417571 RepID=UPI003D34C1D5|nr:tetratricopeptide repeat protein [Marinilabiliaceae bacterium N1Y90]